MEDNADTKRGTPMLPRTSKQGLSRSAADMHYESGDSNLASSSGTNSYSSGVQRMEEGSESWHEQRACMQDMRRGPECRKSLPIPSKVTKSHSSGAQRSLRSKSVVALQDDWNPFQSISESIDSSQLRDMDADTILSTGLWKGLGLSEVPALAGHRYTGVSLAYSRGSSAISGSSGSNSHSGLLSGQAISIGDCTLANGYRREADERAGRARASSGLSLAGTPTRLARNWTHHSPVNTLAEGSIGELSVGETVTNSLPMDPQGGDGQVHLDGTTGNNIDCLSNPLTSNTNKRQGKLVEGAPCKSDYQRCFGSAAVDRGQLKEIPTLNGDSLVSLGSNSCTINNHVRSGSRASACKRKSCTSSLLINASCRSGSPHCSGSRESHSVRFTGGCSTVRRISGTAGCVFASDIVASASAVVTGRCAETSVATIAVDEPHPRKNPIPRDGDSPGSNGASSSSSGVLRAGTTGPSGVNTTGASGKMDHHTLTKTQPPFALAVQRAIPALHPGNCWSETVSAGDCSSNTDFGSENDGILMRSTEQLMASGGGHRSGSQSVSSSRNLSTASGSRKDHMISSSFGVEPSHRYNSGSNRNMMIGSSGSVGRINTEGRLRVRTDIKSTTELPNSFGSVAGQSQSLANTQGVFHSRIVSRSSPARLPPHAPNALSRQNLSTVQVSMLSSSSSELVSSRMPPSFPSAGSSFSSAIEVLPSGSSFQGSLLPRSSPFVNGRSERGFGSEAEGIVGFPFRGLQLSDGEHQPRLVAEGLAEILLALDQVEQDEDLTYEQLLMLEATLLFGGMGLHDQHSDLRLDVDNMSYEELLALEERIGNVNTGLTIDVVNKHLKKVRYSSQAAVIAGSQESDIKCSVCQEEYEDGDELGEIDCGHSYHVTCIKQWLVQKNLCPICKASAVS